ncbi:SIMPL domain-containing protein [Paenibacillus qinlingensis]|uniref:SIMPL domain-containing protein n=1 Tax=Paenibacillus qinlingensis TaxID=1837343 RepID=UPI001565A854|nr:SIMPL domain-containing protein [Paenibacillus qinlingensis]NQX58087.1 SIMPL domain-containing protein [Paenibacillus qinlingensis]
MYMYPPFYRSASLPQLNQSSTVEVVGEGTVSAAPDRAEIVLGAVTEGPDLTKIQTENSRIISNVIHSLIQLSIPREKIQTTDYRIDIQYDYKDGKQIFRGYKVTHLLQILNDQIAQTRTIVDTSVANGANEVTSIQFSMIQPETYELQALSQAIHNARQKALTITHTLGTTLASTPYQVKELYRTSEPVPYMASKLVANAATPIQPGQIVFQAKVQTWFHFA